MISDQAKRGLEASVHEFGDLSIITVNTRTGCTVAGHQRLSVLRERGAKMEHDEAGPFIRDPLTGEVFRVRVVDWDETKERQANVTANNSAIAGTFTFDVVKMVGEFKAEMPSELFEALQFQPMIASLSSSVKPTARGKSGKDEVPEAPKVPVTQKGDLWILGDHRIICADSRDRDAMAKLMDGEKAQLYATDPPYGVGYDGTAHPLNAKDSKAGKEPGTNSKDWGDEYWDHYKDKEEYQQMLVDIFKLAREYLDDNAAWYTWHAASMIRENWAAWEAAGVRYHQTVIWIKPCAIMGYSMWNFKDEPCMMGWVQGNRPVIHKIDEMTNVWEIDWEGKGRCTDGVHPTQKPIRVFELPMQKHTNPGDICLESFSGSGSQIIAGESTGRRVFAIERMPNFTDVAVIRWQAYSGKEATLDVDGRTFSEIAKERGIVLAQDSSPQNPV